MTDIAIRAVAGGYGSFLASLPLTPPLSNFSPNNTLGDGVVVNRGDDLVGIEEGQLECDAVTFDLAVSERRSREALELYRVLGKRSLKLSKEHAQITQLLDSV